ncbi:MAG: ribokinase [Anaerolineae bacterium CG_4_9_14_3_um_filter_57_17]|nr:ribokinase [bacterium]NCT20797.1 ribokinase [bacterium]OIO84147.1 MAG: hypothetical protein AUK01_10295 [Anaerolineae bacterium CG2_30_57_67]PJB68654.1 MAG: ribokinase [Anaerolineae bacterium CG_4_9_14_3_um_filter_57_17]
MLNLAPLEPVDYLVFGHLTLDQTPQGAVLGGSAAYAALTAAALGLRVGVVTAWGGEIPLTALGKIPVIAAPAESSTTFENISASGGRIQFLRARAPEINFLLTPEAWRRAKIMHLAPVAAEVAPILPENLRPTLLGLTPQGWMRAWDASGRVRPCAWQAAESALPAASAVVFSLEDVGGDEEQIEALAHFSRLMVVTEGAAGCRVFWHGDSRRFRAPTVREVDATGAGDIFAAAFFIRLTQTRDPWEAARFASQAAAISVTRPGLQGVPTPAEIQRCLVEVIS